MVERDRVPEKVTSLFIGRWQPLHEGHEKLIQVALDEGNEVVVVIRDTPIDEDNPFTVGQRIEMIRRVFGYEVSIRVIPNTTGKLEICFGRDVGYGFRRIHLSEEMEEISGTNIRSTRDIPTATSSDEGELPPNIG